MNLNPGEIYFTKILITRKVEQFRNWAKQAPKTQSVEKKQRILCMRFVVLYNFEIKQKKSDKI